MNLPAPGVAGCAAAALPVPALRTPFVRTLYIESRRATPLHLLGGLPAIAPGAFRVDGRLRYSNRISLTVSTRSMRSPFQQ